MSDLQTKPFRVVVVSHAAMLQINQEPFDALAQAGADVTLIVPRRLDTDIRGTVVFGALPGFKGTIVPLETSVGGYSRLMGGQRGIHLILYRGLRAAIADARPDVIFVEEEPYSLAAWQVARRAPAPFVVHENQNIVRTMPPPFQQIRTRVLSRAAGATVRNRAAEQVLRAAGYAGAIARFPHAVDPARFANAGRRTNLAPPIVGFVGRLVPEKGVQELVDAMAAIRREVPASLLVIGDGPARAELERHAASLRVPIEMHGALPHDEVPAWYASMDLVAIPSRTTPTWKEQFGRIVIEANAAAVPVVTSDSGELPSTVAATGGGVYVGEGDTGALEAALLELLHDDVKRKRLGEAGRVGVEAHFTPSVVARELLAFLRMVAA